MGGVLMREWCGCGASIRARRKDVLAWRTNHRHDGKEEPEPDKQGAFADTQLAYQPSVRDDSERAIPDIQLGFQPNRYSERSQQLAGILRDKALKNLGR